MQHHFIHLMSGHCPVKHLVKTIPQYPISSNVISCGSVTLHAIIARRVKSIIESLMHKPLFLCQQLRHSWQEFPKQNTHTTAFQIPGSPMHAALDVTLLVSHPHCKRIELSVPMFQSLNPSQCEVVWIIALSI